MQGNNQQISSAYDFSELDAALSEIPGVQHNEQVIPDPNQKKAINIPTDILLKEIQAKKKKTEISQKTRAKKNKKVERSKGYIDKLSKKEKQHKKAKIDKKHRK